jgi:hypothetical protein
METSSLVYGIIVVSILLIFSCGLLDKIHITEGVGNPQSRRPPINMSRMTNGVDGYYNNRGYTDGPEIDQRFAADLGDFGNYRYAGTGRAPNDYAMGVTDMRGAVSVGGALTSDRDAGSNYSGLVPSSVNMTSANQYVALGIMPNHLI